MLTYLFERMRTISYASNADTLLIRDKRANCEPLHRHNYNEMIYIYEGEAVHSINGVSYNLVPGSLALLTPERCSQLHIGRIVLNGQHLLHRPRESADSEL